MSLAPSQKDKNIGASFSGSSRGWRPCFSVCLAFNQTFQHAFLVTRALFVRFILRHRVEEYGVKFLLFRSACITSL